MEYEIKYFELRLNNCVSYNNNNVRIHEITAWGIKTSTTFLISTSNYISFKDLKPIKIGAFTLQKSNFKFKGKGCFVYEDIFEIFLENKKWYIILNGNKFFIEYLHELQNIYSFIFKKEIEISLI